jgi:hypothetical protein
VEGPHDLRQRAQKIIEIAKQIPEKQPINSEKHDLRVKPQPSIPAKVIIISMACFQNILSTFQSGHSDKCQRNITTIFQRKNISYFNFIRK